jgi:SAM-dependent methyltransferase
MYQFLLYIQDVQNALQLCKDDTLLDAGGGPGWTTFHIAPFVSHVTMFDYSHELVKQAQEQAKAFSHVIVFQDDILKMDHIGYLYNKVLIGSVLQYLNNMDEVKQAIQNIYNIMAPGGIALFTHNPDASKKESHLATVPQTGKSLKMEQERLWIDHHDIFDIAMDIGFREFKVIPINPLIWQSGHMFDFTVIR